MDWRKLFPIIFLFSCIDGFFVNLLYPSSLALLAKDILVLIVYVMFILQEPMNKWVSQFKKSIGAGTWYMAMLLIVTGMIQILNPSSPTVLVGVMGFKVMFFYWPLAILSYAYIDNLNDVQRLLKAVVYLSIPICIFGLIQFWQGPGFMVRQFGQGFSRALSIGSAAGKESGEFVRVLGTFPSSGLFGLFLFTNTMFILGLLFTARTIVEKWIMSSCLTLSYITLLATGSRGSSLLLFASTAIFIILCRWLWRTFFIVLLVIISLNFGFGYLGRVVTARFKSIQDIEMIKQRTVRTTVWEFEHYLEKYPFGRGLGMASAASRYVSGGMTAELGYVENYLSKLQYELGIAGVILFYLFLLGLTFSWIRHWLGSPDRTTYVIIAALSAYCFVIFSCTFVSLIETAPIGIFLWFEIGAAAKLATLHSDDQYPLST